MSGLTLSSVDLLWLEQVGSGNNGMMRPWDVGNVLGDELVFSRKPSSMDGSATFPDQLFYRIHFSFLVGSLKCLCHNRDPFYDFLEKMLGMHVRDHMIIHFACITSTSIEN